jgi:hypothetical protein
MVIETYALFLNVLERAKIVNATPCTTTYGIYWKRTLHSKGGHESRKRGQKCPNATTLERSNQHNFLDCVHVFPDNILEKSSRGHNPHSEPAVECTIMRHHLSFFLQGGL